MLLLCAWLVSVGLYAGTGELVRRTAPVASLLIDLRARCGSVSSTGERGSFLCDMRASLLSAKKLGDTSEAAISAGAVAESSNLELELSDTISVGWCLSACSSAADIEDLRVDRLENIDSRPVLCDFPSSAEVLLLFPRQQNQTSAVTTAATMNTPTAIPTLAPVDRPFDGIFPPGPGHVLSSGLAMLTIAWGSELDGNRA